MRVRVESKNLEYKSTVKAKTRVKVKDEYSNELQIGLLVVETERWSIVTLDTRSDLHFFSEYGIQDKYNERNQIVIFKPKVCS